MGPKQVLVAVATAMGLAASGIAHAAITASFDFNPLSVTAGPTDVITMHATISNSTTSTESLIFGSGSTADFNLGDAAGIYDLTFGALLPEGFTLAPGASADFDFGTLTPSAPVALGTYVTGGADIVFVNGSDLNFNLRATSPFTVTVIGATVPEPSALALLGIALAGLGFSRGKR